MRDAKIATLYKNYMEIILIASIIEDAGVVMNMLQCVSESINSEAQCGFRAASSTMNMVFPLK